MKKSTKAVLFSTLLFPGSGHMVLGYWWRGWAIVIPPLLALGYILTYSVDRAMLALDKVLTGEISPDMASIQRFLSESQSPGAATLVTMGTYAILLIWVLAAADAYRLGSKAADSTPAGNGP